MSQRKLAEENKKENKAILELVAGIQNSLTIRSRSAIPGFTAARSRSPSPGPDRVCFHCRKPGHFARECPDKQMAERKSVTFEDKTDPKA